MEGTMEVLSTVVHVKADYKQYNAELGPDTRMGLALSMSAIMSEVQRHFDELLQKIGTSGIEGSLKFLMGEAEVDAWLNQAVQLQLPNFDAHPEFPYDDLVRKATAYAHASATHVLIHLRKLPKNLSEHIREQATKRVIVDLSHESLLAMFQKLGGKSPAARVSRMGDSSSN